MKFSENWLRQLVDIPATRDELTHRLTMCGLEVESVEALGDGLEGVVIGEIVEAEQHPNADRLRVCKVNIGQPDWLNIVCGAPNARVGLKAPVAMIGATLPGGLQIKAAKLRGVDSSGMLCSAKELGTDGDASGLLELPASALVGQSFAEWLGLPDAVIELGLTPNRSDCLGLRGLAMEVSAEFGSELRLPELAAVAPGHDQQLVIHLLPGAGCPRYCGRVINGLNTAAKTPSWMVERLRRSGLRTISALVDVTNYVMLELGQPLHAFDADRVVGAISVRRARASEACTLLDGRELSLDSEFLVIADDEGAIALAGVMGGFGSRVTESTSRVFLESAHFSASAISGRARRLGLHTDASHRFERGVDPELPRLALERATALLLEIAGGSAGPITEAVIADELPQRQAVILRHARLTRVLGIEVPTLTVHSILAALGMQVESTEAGWRVIPPSWRFDIEIEEDLIEEVARIHGYDQIPTVAPRGELEIEPVSESRLPLIRLRERLVARGYSEAITFAFLGKSELERWGMADAAISLANPLSADLAVMRTSMLPGLIEALVRNQNRQRGRVRLFEIGRSYRSGSDHPLETELMSLVISGEARPEQWGEAARPVDFYDLKADVEALMQEPGEWVAGGPDCLHPGRRAQLLLGGVVVGFIGALHPQLARQLDVDGEVLVAELSLEVLRARAMPKARQLSRFPSVRRDLALVVPETVTFNQVHACVVQAAGDLLRECCLFDVYRGSGIETGSKSFAIGLIFQDDSRTLGDADVDRLVAAVITQSVAELGAQVRS